MPTFRRIRRTIAAILLVLYLPACYHWVTPQGMTPQEYIAAKHPGHVGLTLRQDLAVAERFGPLDVEADNMRTWADLYATGASYWGLDWPKVLEYFSQIIQLAPNLRDSTNMTATERYRVASIRYGDFLASNGDWCSALEQYQAAFEMGSDPSVEPTASWVGNKCEEDQREDKGGDEEPTETPPTEGTPSPETPTEPPPTEETPTPETPQPSEP